MSNDLAEENERLRAYALHMQKRYQAYRDHSGTTGTYPDPESVALLERALTMQKPDTIR